MFLTCTHNASILQEYHNSLFLNIALKYSTRLHVQNSSIRVVTWCRHFNHSLPRLKPLRCLPVQYHVVFKVSAILYQICKQPTYLQFYLTPIRKPVQL